MSDDYLPKRIHLGEKPPTPPQPIKALDLALKEALTKIVAAGIPVQECTPHHLKYGSLNYYPKKGTIHRDGAEDPEPSRGIDTFIELCLSAA